MTTTKIETKKVHKAPQAQGQKAPGISKGISLGIPQFSIKQMLEAGVHFGHKTMRRNPKMSKYIYTNKNGISIIDLGKSAALLSQALTVAKEVAKNNGKILFIATKRQASDTVLTEAKRCGQFFVNHRWLGGMLTNWKTVSKSIKTLKKIEEQLADSETGYSKKEKLVLERQRQKLELALGGIKDMGGYPDLVFIIDVRKESLAIAEAKTLGIPVMAIVDTNVNPDPVTYKIPGNDDSVKAIKLYCRLIADAIIAGIKESMAASGVDISKFGNELPQVKKVEERKPVKLEVVAVEEKAEVKEAAKVEIKTKKVAIAETAKKPVKAEQKPAAKEEKVVAKTVVKKEEKAPAKKAAAKPAAKKPVAKKGK